jgi:hypothetical protein
VATGDPPGAALASSKTRIEELERMVGRQQLDLAFFAKRCDLPTRFKMTTASKAIFMFDW